MRILYFHIKQRLGKRTFLDMKPCAKTTDFIFPGCYNSSKYIVIDPDLISSIIEVNNLPKSFRRLPATFWLESDQSLYFG